MVDTVEGMPPGWASKSKRKPMGDLERAARAISMCEAAEPETWELVDHICASCWTGRLLRRRVDRAWLYRCSNCGMLGEGESKGAPVICACNSMLGSRVNKEGKQLGVPRLAGVRCMPGSGEGAEIVVGEG